MKKIVAIILLVLYIISVGSFHVTAQEEMTDESVTMGSHSMDALVPVLGSQQLIKNAKSVILYEVNTDTLMYAWNADEKLSPSSLIKVLTALVAIEQGDLTSIVTVKRSVLDSVVYNAAKTGFEDGETVTLEDLLYCMLVDSGNDAAALIADHIAGSQSVFVETLNTYAQELGCVDTNITNAHGLHDDNQYTTARDMGRILAAAVKNETFRTIFGTLYYTVPATNLSEERYLSSGNLLINPEKSFYDRRVIGGRTGIAQNGDRCIATLAENNGLSYISVIMGAQLVYEENGVQTRSEGAYQETHDLLDLGFEGYQSSQLIFAGQILKQKSVVNGDCAVSLGAYESAAAVLPVGVTMADITVQYTDSASEISAPVEAGQHISSVKFMYGNLCVAQAALYAMNDVRVASSTNVDSVPDRDNQATRTFTTVIMIILISAVVVFALLRLIKMIRRSCAHNRSRKHRQDRRRSH